MQILSGKFKSINGTTPNFKCCLITITLGSADLQNDTFAT